MKKFIYIFLLYWCFNYSHSQSNPFSISCAFDEITTKETKTLLPQNCANTSPYYYTNSLYLPQSNDEIIYLKLNFIFLTKPDGTGNFEQNNLEHVQVIDDVISRVNHTLLNLVGLPTPSCEGYGFSNLTNTKIQFLVNKIWKIDPAWDYLYTGYNPNCPSPPCSNFNLINPASTDYYYSYYDNDPTIPSGINVVFANNGNIYDEFITVPQKFKKSYLKCLEFS